MITNPNLVTPRSSPIKVIKLAVLRALEPLLATYTDELGVVVPDLVVRDTFTKEQVGYPNITVHVDGGAIVEMNGHNLVTEDDTGTNYFYEVTYEGALIKIAMETRLSLERERLLDFLLGGAHSYAVYSQFVPNPWIIPEAVQTSLAANGIWLRATQDISLPDPPPNDPRPADTIYKASFTWRCDVSLQYSLAGVLVSEVAVAATLSAGNQSRTTDIVVS